jgi:hypothetical protein
MFPIKKINIREVLKLWENCCFIILSTHIQKLEISGCDIPKGTYILKWSAQDTFLDWNLLFLYLTNSLDKKFYTVVSSSIYMCDFLGEF